MSRIFKAASAAAITLTALTAVALTVPGFAEPAGGPGSGQVIQSAAPGNAGVTVFDENVAPPANGSQPYAEPAPAPVSADIADAAAPVVRASTLAAMVSGIAHSEPETAELRCLAAGVFYESKSEPLLGQLAVANVIRARAASGRFARTNCGVLTQRGQFSFVRGGVVPTPTAGAQWRTAVAIARIAQAGGWANPTPGAMFFHASRVSPSWNRPRVAQLGNHVFYR